MLAFELSVARGHRVPCQLLHFFGWHLPMKGYYQVGMPISLFRQLRSTGWFKEQLLHFQREFFDLFQVPFKAVLNEFVERNNRRNNRLSRMTQKERFAAAEQLPQQRSQQLRIAYICAGSILTSTGPRNE